MKILHITASYKPAYIYGGPIYSVAALCEASTSLSLTRERSKSEVEGQKLEISNSLLSNVEVITTLANGKEELHYPSGVLQMVDGVPVRYFKRWTKDHSHFSPALLWWLWKNIKNYDVIHIHAWWNLVSVLSALIAYLRNKNVIFTPRGTLSHYSFQNKTSAPKIFFHKLIGKHLLQSFTFHTTSKLEEDDILKLLSLKYIKTIPNIVELPWSDSSKFLSEYKPNESTLKIIFLSRIERKKGLELLFHSLSRLDFDFSLEIGGIGEPYYIEELKLLSKTLNIDKKIQWLGLLDKSSKYLHLTKSDVFVLPSYNENFANVVIESLFTGTPVIITEEVGLSDYVKDKNLGWVCKRHEDDLIKALNQSKEYQKTSNASRIQSIIKEDYKESQIIKQYLEFYKSTFQHRQS